MTSRPRRILLAGESWIMHTIHQKGVDSFTTTAYGEGHGWLEAALTGAGLSVEHLPNHLASSRFPTTLESLKRYDAVILSDIGSNTLLLHPEHVRAVAGDAEPPCPAAGLRLGRRWVGNDRRLLYVPGARCEGPVRRHPCGGCAPGGDAPVR